MRKVATILHPPARRRAGRASDRPSSASARESHPSASIGPHAVIGARRGDRRARPRSAPACVIGDGVAIGDDVRAARERHDLRRAASSARAAIVHCGAVIGADGFGMAEEDGRWLKIPQIGRVVIGADVEIGANTTIDRGAIDDTVIEDDVKLDNQIQIGHNCRIGAHTAIAGCVGIAGSARIGRNCKIGGAAMIAGHLDDCRTARSISAAPVILDSIDEPRRLHRRLPDAAASRRGSAWRSGSGISPDSRIVCAPLERAPQAQRQRTRRARRAQGGAMTTDETRCDGHSTRSCRDLPHRYPMLLVDRVVECEPGQVDPRAQERDDQRAVLPGPFPGVSR